MTAHHELSHDLPYEPTDEVPGAGRQEESSTRDARECPGCHASFVPRRADQLACSATCRKRKQREAEADDYVVTEEDRAAMRRVIERDGHGHPMAQPLDPERVRKYIAATAVRTGEDSP